MMTRVDVEREIAHVQDPFSREQARITWEFHNAIWYDNTLTGDLRRLWGRLRRSKPS